MMDRSPDGWRGHPIILVMGVWLYADTLGPVAGAPRGCGHCGLSDTPEGHDGCLGALPGAVINACCGHGVPGEAYIQYEDGSRLDGQSALDAAGRLRTTEV